jgi:hypothetical protein
VTWKAFGFQNIYEGTMHCDGYEGSARFPGRKSRAPRTSRLNYVLSRTDSMMNVAWPLDLCPAAGRLRRRTRAKQYASENVPNRFIPITILPMPTIQEMEAVLSSVWDRVSSRLQAGGVSALSSAERAFAAIWMLEAEVNNGGFSQYMFNDPGDEAEVARAALVTVGARATLTVFEDFLALVPAGHLVSARGPRQDQLDEWAENLGEDEFEKRLRVLEHSFYQTEDDLRRCLFDFACGENLVAVAEP